MNIPDRDLERLLREACPPIEPSAAFRSRVLAAAAPRRSARRVLRLVLPYAAGALSALAGERMLSAAAPPPASPSSPPSSMFEPIADRAPRAPPTAPVGVPAPAPASTPAAAEPDAGPPAVASVPLPRIS